MVQAVGLPNCINIPTAHSREKPNSCHYNRDIFTPLSCPVRLHIPTVHSSFPYISPPNFQLCGAGQFSHSGIISVSALCAYMRLKHKHTFMTGSENGFGLSSLKGAFAFGSAPVWISDLKRKYKEERERRTENKLVWFFLRISSGAQTAVSVIWLYGE